MGATVEDDVAFGLENRQVPRLKMQTIVHDVINQVGMLKFQKVSHNIYLVVKNNA